MSDQQQLLNNVENQIEFDDNAPIKKNTKVGDGKNPVVRG